MFERGSGRPKQGEYSPLPLLAALEVERDGRLPYQAEEPEADEPVARVTRHGVQTPQTDEPMHREHDTHEDRARDDDHSHRHARLGSQCLVSFIPICVQSSLVLQNGTLLRILRNNLNVFA